MKRRKRLAGSAMERFIVWLLSAAAFAGIIYLAIHAPNMPG
jgi:hypothetical protein